MSRKNRAHMVVSREKLANLIGLGDNFEVITIIHAIDCDNFHILLYSHNGILPEVEEGELAPRIEIEEIINEVII